MKSNMGTMDKAVRVLAAMVIIGLYFGNIISGTIAIIFLVIASVFILTSFISFCSLYTILGVSTCKKQN